MFHYTASLEFFPFVAGRHQPYWLAPHYWELAFGNVITQKGGVLAVKCFEPKLLPCRTYSLSVIKDY